ncbi:MAG: glutamine--fructose-6-phosphate transaminase (isomerizing), partial [Clostridia bacterium]|nr:glutamine--fructose-6-phosphate transaminase (isomerizing) [Clostridia bacterium]
MCGIVGYIGESESAPILLSQLKKLEYRGYDSAGIAVIKDGKINVFKVSGKVEELCKKTDDGKGVSGTCGIGHTRWATHGAPTDVNAHPHLSKSEKIAIVHNGIIENYAELREELKAKGFNFQSQTDTEVIANLIDSFYEGDIKKAVMKASMRLTGSYALGVICSDFPDKIIIARESSPLIIGVGVGCNYYASDITALVSYTKNVIYLNDGEFAEITRDGVEVFDSTGETVKKQISRVSWSVEKAEKGGYEHFMLKEIMEQPGVVNATISPRIKDGEIVLEDFPFSDEDLKNINKVQITACGSAYYAGVSGKFVFEKLCRIPVSVDLGSELRYSDPIIDEHTLCIVISQSGETADTIAAMKECKRLGAKVVAIVNVVGSTIARLADCVLYTHAGPEIAVATTKGFTTQLSVMYLLSIYFAYHTGKIDRTEYSSLINDLQKIPHAIQRAMDKNILLEYFAEKYYNSSSLFFLGRNTDYAIALEGALKMKEISYV